jgi:hypothetical protein
MAENDEEVKKLLALTRGASIDPEPTKLLTISIDERGYYIAFCHVCKKELQDGDCGDYAPNSPDGWGDHLAGHELLRQAALRKAGKKYLIAAGDKIISNHLK